jgi:hypothetical protein
MKKNLRLLFILIILAAAAGVAYYFNSNKETVVNQEFSEFAVQDTSTITKIFIADYNNQTILLERNTDDPHWTLNGEFRARYDAVKLLLETFERIGVKGPVPISARENVIKMISSTAVKVEIYQSDELSKVYYIGSCTQDHVGTYMVLETVDGDRSPDPFITHMSGFTGCLRQRFFTGEEDWRYTGVFAYPNLEFSKIEVLHNYEPERSFEIQFAGENDIKLYSRISGGYISEFDTLAVKDYMLMYKKRHFESFNSHLNEAGEDSLLKTIPAYTIRVTGNDNDIQKVDLYWKQASSVQYDFEGNELLWDGDHMYGCQDGRDVVFVQRPHFGPLLQGIERFLNVPADLVPN